MNIILVGIGGGLGAVCRYLLSEVIKKHYFGKFPIYTFLINILGSFLFGLSLNSIDSPEYKNLIQVGFFGGFTTFSTYMVESKSLKDNVGTFYSIFYLISSLVFGVVGFLIGMRVGRAH